VLVGEVRLVVVIVEVAGMHCLKLSPTRGLGKVVVRHAPLDVEGRLDVVLQACALSIWRLSMPKAA
jgi:hypothetical protein